MFQYMLLLRGATFVLPGGYTREEFQYMLLLRGATDTAARPPHANTFQYMLLLRGATLTPREFAVYKLVSIHAPLARSNLHVPLL